MAGKGLKPVARGSAREALAAVDVVAREAGLPPATLPQGAKVARPAEGAGGEELVQVNVRVRRGLGDQLADRARVEGTTQKVLICRALAAVGFDVHPDDLKAAPTPRRRGSS